MNAKLVIRLSVLAIAGAVLTGCANQDANHAMEGGGMGAAAGAAMGAIFGGGSGAAKGAAAGALLGSAAGGFGALKRLFGDDTPDTRVTPQPNGGAKVVLSDKVTFGEGQVRPIAGGNLALDRIVTYLKQNPNAQARAVGYSDSGGSDELNQRLSKRRAQMVLDYLSTNGVPGVQLLPAEGAGAIDPVASNDTEEGRRQNRRVEVYVLPNGSPAPVPTVSP